MFSEIENIIFDPKRWIINLYCCPSLDVYFETKKVVPILLSGKKSQSLEVEPSARLVFTFKLFCFCASLLRTQSHTPRHTRARALRNNMNNEKADGHCHGFAWI